MNEQEKDLYISQLEEENLRLKQSNKSLRTNNKGLLKGINKLNRQMSKHKKKKRNGTLIELPFAVGTDIYRIIDADEPFVNHRDFVNLWEIQYDGSIVGYCYGTGEFTLDDVGKTIFLTEKEAEEKLKWEK